MKRLPTRIPRPAGTTPPATRTATTAPTSSAGPAARRCVLQPGDQRREVHHPGGVQQQPVRQLRRYRRLPAERIARALGRGPGDYPRNRVLALAGCYLAEQVVQ